MLCPSYAKRQASFFAFVPDIYKRPKFIVPRIGDRVFLYAFSLDLFSVRVDGGKASSLHDFLVIIIKGAEQFFTFL
jgi:hypothetical protein